ncbi:MAG TPA: cyclic nucleotide-binding domain-containing protein [Gaiellaceae bacterium]|nr:cyclic nucleotide-binding domain-containing protein [Gaiellaceae bacterium]
MVRKNAKIELLRQVPLFAGCSRRELAEIALRSTDVSLPAGRVLMKEGDAGREFMVLISGSAEVRRGGQWVAELSDGDFLGEISLVADVPRTATVTTLTPADVLLLTARDFKTLMRDVPSLQPKVVYALAMRLPPEFQ